MSFFSTFRKPNKNLLTAGNHQTRKGNGFLSWLAVVLGLVAFFFVFRGFWIEWEKRKAIDQEVEALQKEIDKLSQEKSGMQEVMRYLKTRDFQEKELKDKLNLVKEGEEVVYLQEKNYLESDTKEKIEESQEKEPAVVSIKKPNYYYWWKFLFQM